MSAPENSYASLGERLIEIATKIRAGEPVTHADLLFVEHVGSTELPAIDDVIQSLTLQAMTMSREALHHRRMFEQMQVENSRLHEHNVRLGVDLAQTLQPVGRGTDG